MEQWMEVISSVSELRNRLKPLRMATIGFAPTMGYLHKGHLTLMEVAKSQNQTVVASVFVNPTQFVGPKENFAKYPRDLERDRSMLESVGVDVLFAPDVPQMYGPGSQTYVDVPEMGAILEGAIRPGYFRGVATVVAKLLNIVQPNRAYFGEKDFQQVALIRRMVEDLFLPVEIVAVPTVRDSDGVALSSQLAYLNEAQRAAVRRLPQALALAERLIRSGQTDVKGLEATIRSYIAEEPLAQVDVVSVRDAATLQEVTAFPARALVLLFVRFGRAQLVDHVVVEIERRA
jgi:pantoate--beta-alanine ligase